jgi:hypothetical protein
MSRKKRNKPHYPAARTSQSSTRRTGFRLSPRWIIIGLLFLGAGFGARLAVNAYRDRAAQNNAATLPAPGEKILQLPKPGQAAAPLPAQTIAASTPGRNREPELLSMKIAEAVMVTTELDFGPKVPTIAEALREIERVYVPDDKQGRTFSILDAYGQPTADRKLHISMHVSSEKTGLGSLVFKRTGEIIWRSRIGSPDQPQSAGEKKLVIYFKDEKGNPLLVDGSKSGDSLLDVKVSNTNQKVREVWPDGAEREVTLIYSACGCPVKIMVRRAGEAMVRTSDLPVIFPDDPAAVSMINRLLRLRQS